MAIFGIGVDLVETSRFVASKLEIMAKRLLTQNEYYEFLETEKKDVFLAKKFASKEAVAKSLGTGIGSKISFQDIEISHSSLGKPICTIKPEILQRITNSRNSKVFISIADTQTLVTVYAIVEI